MVHGGRGFHLLTVTHIARPDENENTNSPPPPQRQQASQALFVLVVVADVPVMTEYRIGTHRERMLLPGG